MNGATRRTIMRALALLPAVGAGLLAPRASVASTVPDAAVRSVYETIGATPIWTGGTQAEAHRVAMLALLNRERRLDPGLTPDTFALAARLSANDTAVVAQAEHELTRIALAYLTRRSGGLPVQPGIFTRVMTLLERTIADSELDVALLELQVIEALGGWIEVTSRTTAPTATAEGEEPAKPRTVIDQTQLRRRLVQSMDLSARHLDGSLSGAALSNAVKAFQGRYDLQRNGSATGRTLTALNQPIGTLLGRVKLNVERRTLLADRSAYPRYVEVNLPGYGLRMIEGGRVKLEMRVVVGDPDTETPVFDDLMRFIEVNPSWYVPASIVKEMTTKFTNDPSLFDRQGYAWRANGGLVQKPGPDNALGRFKFLFPNRHAVYLHDTAQRGYFNRASRSLSHGCVRLEKPLELAEAILGAQGWDAERLQQTIKAKRTRRIDLTEPMPVFLDYQTVVVDPETGQLRQLPDIYGHDAKRVVAFAEKQSPAGGPLTPEPEVVPVDPEVVPETAQPAAPLQQEAAVTTRVSAVAADAPPVE